MGNYRNVSSSIFAKKALKILAVSNYCKMMAVSKYNKLPEMLFEVLIEAFDRVNSGRMRGWSIAFKRWWPLRSCQNVKNWSNAFHFFPGLMPWFCTKCNSFDAYVLFYRESLLNLCILKIHYEILEFLILHCTKQSTIITRIPGWKDFFQIL